MESLSQIDVVGDSQANKNSSHTPPLRRRLLWRWVVLGRVFARPTLDFEMGVWVLVPSNIGLAFLAGEGQGHLKIARICGNNYVLEIANI